MKKDGWKNAAHNLLLGYNTFQNDRSHSLLTVEAWTTYVFGKGNKCVFGGTQLDIGVHYYWTPIRMEYCLFDHLLMKSYHQKVKFACFHFSYPARYEVKIETFLQRNMYAVNLPHHYFCQPPELSIFLAQEKYSKAVCSDFKR